MLKDRKWRVFLENDCIYCQSPCHTLHHILFSPSGLTGFMCAGMGSAGWAWQQWLLHLNKVRTQQCTSVFVVSSLLLCFCLSVFSDVSLHQWMMSPPWTWVILHLQPASQLFSELSTDTHAWTHSSAQHNISSSEAMWFLESPEADVSHASASTWIILHPVFLSPLSFLLCLYVSSL